MNGYWVGAIATVLGFLQLWLCRRGKKRIVKLIPVLVILGLMIGCVTAYIISGHTNWAFLILILLLFGLLVADGVAWVVYGIWRLIVRLRGC